MRKARVSLIVAVGLNNEIGKDNRLLWHIKDDLRLFMGKTSQHVVIHGRKSFESIGTPLRNRSNIIITRDKGYTYPGCFVCHTLEEAMVLGQKLEQKGELFILGGAQIYEQSMQWVDRMYISHVNGSFPEADTFFPQVDLASWNQVEELHFEQNKENEYSFKFCVYDRS